MGKEKKVTVYVVTHKPVDLTPLKLDSCYRLIRVGPYAKETAEGIAADNTGDNISEKNPNYCELTAHYWMWKNDDSDVIGLCHYRRYLTTNALSEDPSGILNQEEIMKALEDHDVILPYRPAARRTVKEIYLDFGFEKDLDTLRAVIAEKYPDYVAEYDALMARHSNYPANMLICSKALFNEYSAWLFDILFEVERRSDLTGYTPQQARIYGFMSERLLEVWVKHKHLRIKHFRWLNTEKDYDIKSKAKDILSIAMTPLNH